jgi:predicted GNAT family acetyltransferase
MLEIRPINLSDIPLEIVSEGKKKGLIFRDSDNALYFGGFLDGKLVTLSCLVIYKNKNATIKANFTLEEHREKGYFSELNRHVLNYARDRGVEVINLNCLKDSVDIHVKQGARVWKTTKNIFWLMDDQGF